MYRQYIQNQDVESCGAMARFPFSSEEFFLPTEITAVSPYKHCPKSKKKKKLPRFLFPPGADYI